MLDVANQLTQMERTASAGRSNDNVAFAPAVRPHDAEWPSPMTLRRSASGPAAVRGPPKGPSFPRASTAPAAVVDCTQPLLDYGLAAALDVQKEVLAKVSGMPEDQVAVPDDLCIVLTGLPQSREELPTTVQDVLAKLGSVDLSPTIFHTTDDVISGTLTGCGYLAFTSDSMAASAIEALNGESRAAVPQVLSCHMPTSRRRQVYGWRNVLHGS